MRSADRRARTAGMTLIELLVAFAVFLMLVGMLVGLATTGLRTWEAGEQRKEAYDRLQGSVRRISDDLRSTWADDRWIVVEGVRLPHAGFTCDPDPKTKVQRLRFVRSGDDRRLNAAQGRVNRNLGTGYYTDLWEIAYQLDPPGMPKGLYRGAHPFTRGSSSILEARVLENPSLALWRDSFRLVDDGVLWIQWRFWTQYTTTWDDKSPLKQAPRLIKQVDTKGTEALKIGPSQVWDSSRSRLSSFQPFHRPLEVEDPDFVYPEIVQVQVEVETGASGPEGVKLAGPVDDKTLALNVSDSRPLPDAEGDATRFLRIEDEWIEYRGKAGSEIVAVRRGARGTTAASHAHGTPVRFGEVFLTDVPIPVSREKVR